MGKSAPAAPDYRAAAQEQAESSREVTEQQTWANRPTINTPFGQQTWEVTPQWDPSTGQYLNTWTQNTNLTPESQAALDAQMGLQQGRSELAGSLLGRVQDEYGDTMDWSQFQELAGTPGTPDYNPEAIQRNLSTEGMQQVQGSQPYYNKAGDAIFSQWESRNAPKFERDADQLRTKLYNQGIKEGDQAFDQAMQDLQQGQTDARNQASFDATIGAGQEAQRMQGMDMSLRGQQFGERQGQGAFANSAAAQSLQQQLGIGAQRYGQQMQGANYQNQLRQQQISEEMQRRGFSLNEINAILTGQQVGMPSMPSFNTAQRSEGVQALSAAQMTGQANLDAFNAEQQATQGMMSGIAGGAMMFSDPLLKKDVVKIGKIKQFNLYVWHWIFGGTAVGVMADEVPADCVSTDPRSGYMMVDYGRL